MTEHGDEVQHRRESNHRCQLRVPAVNEQRYTHVESCDHELRDLHSGEVLLPEQIPGDGEFTIETFIFPIG